MPRRRVRGSGIAAFLLDEHIPRDFEKLLDAFGHSVAPARGLGLQGTSDVEFLRAVVAGGWDALISLDLNRQPEVWSQLMLELVEGRGRLVRLKPRSKEVPTIAVLAGE